ncbi:MAG: hypothetical protein F4Y47_16650 [Acidobacteriia bacterium]|nr:hypothetical protein [Terriglobia bacterium]MYG02796.1 hypothetical protein [Terriglobia bacterium]MYK10575.1 hypothetical protein [Terriglobia bacterium]
MKAGIEHRVPLSDAALTVLERVRARRDESGLTFPFPARPQRPLNDMTLPKVLGDTGLPDRVTVHGFRSSFRDWAAEQTDAPDVVMELSLARYTDPATCRPVGDNGLRGRSHYKEQVAWKPSWPGTLGFRTEVGYIDADSFIPSIRNSSCRPGADHKLSSTSRLLPLVQRRPGSGTRPP